MKLLVFFFFFLNNDKRVKIHYFQPLFRKEEQTLYFLVRRNTGNFETVLNVER